MNKYFIKVISEYRVLIDTESLKEAKNIVSELYIEGDLLEYVGEFDKNRWINVDYGWEIVDKVCKKIKAQEK